MTMQTKTYNLIEEYSKFIDSVDKCVTEAKNADPESSTWTAEEAFIKGSEWAGRHVLIREIENK